EPIVHEQERTRLLSDIATEPRVLIQSAATDRAPADVERDPFSAVHEQSLGVRPERRVLEHPIVRHDMEARNVQRAPSAEAIADVYPAPPDPFSRIHPPLARGLDLANAHGIVPRRYEHSDGFVDCQ